MTSIALLDGGLGQEIYRRAPDVSSPLWSVAVMLEHPEIVTSVHREFIRAGAKTLTLNTYPATPTRLARLGARDQLVAVHQQAFEALQEAIDETDADVDIAGCLPPLTGSYQGEPARTQVDLENEYSVIAETQQQADVFLIETMTNIREARAACAVASEYGKPFGVAFRVEVNGALRSGETLSQAVAAVAGYGPKAIMLNCCDPEILTAAMPELAGMYPVVGGYANAFESIEEMASGGSVDELEARDDIPPTAYTELVHQWIADGARVVGGCCEITPAHIQHLASSLGKKFELIRFSQL